MRSMSNNIWPVITISRQYGTQGAALARQLAEQIGFECWDKEIVQKIAEHSTAPARLFESLDEHRRSAISEMISSVMGDGNPSSAEYLREVNRIVRTLAEHGSAVVVGRGAQFIVYPDRALRVRIIASVDHRAQGLMERKNISHSNAVAEIEQIDEDRYEFVQQSYYKDVHESTHYDLILNSGTTRFDNMIEIILSAYQARFGAFPDKDLTTPPMAMPPVI